jgi:hypothetical protein
MSFKYDGLIKSLEICLRNEWGDTSTSRSMMRSLIWEAQRALIDCREERNEGRRELPSISKTAVSKYGCTGSFGLENGPNHGFRPLDLEELEDQDNSQDHGLGSLLKRIGI